ncbi:hypothetical protein [Cohnella sp. WQ 127256]|uniref:hypothetical protein n=1 Tax=Cohnella sp. WQ 127256 TaxID=2938790 RepID=UPI0021192091|nr:hypothetical protein [Cohnella sp. WQ 127256]
MMHKKQIAISKQAKQMIDQPVCVILNNGSFYVGFIKDVENGRLILSGKKGRGKINHASSHRTKKAMISGFFPGMGFGNLGGGNFGGGGGNLGGGGNFGGAGGNFAPAAAAAAPGGGGGGGFLGGFGGLGGIMNFMNKAWPAVNMGMGMVKSIMPLMGLLKG